MKLTVILPVYIGTTVGQYYRSLDSLLNQTVKDFVILIAIDGPISLSLSDAIAESESCYDRIKVYNSEVNLGLGGILREIVGQVETEYLARMDSDDFSLPDRIEKQMQYLLSNDLDILGSFISEGVVNGKKVLRKVPLNQSGILRRVKFRSPFNHVTVVMRTSILFKENYEPCLFAEDWYLWLRLLKRHPELKVANLPMPLVEVNTDNYIRLTGPRRFKIDKDYLRIFRDEGLIPWYSFVMNLVASFIVRVLLRGRVAWLYKRFLRSIE